MARLASVGALVWACLGAVGARAVETEKVLIGFEREEISRWPGSTVKTDGPARSSQLKGEFTPGSFTFSVFWKGEFKEKNRQTAAKGNATQGEYALSRKTRYRSGGPGEVIPHYPLLRRGCTRILNTFAWPEECFAKDWSGYDLLRIDVRFEAGAEKLWVEIEDDVVEPPVARTFSNLPGGRWVTVEVNLKRAVAERGLDLRRMANIWLVAKCEKGNILVDNIRLAKRAARARHQLMRDNSPIRLPKLTKKRAVYHKAAMKADRSPLKLAEPIVIKTGASKGANVVPCGWVAAYDNRHMMVAFLDGAGGNLKVLQTSDGGGTWKGLEGKDAPTSIKFRNPDHGSSRGGVVDPSGNGMFVSSLGCAGFTSSPRAYCFMFTFKGPGGWEVRTPLKGTRSETYAVGKDYNLVDSDIRHCVSSGMTLRLDSGELWHVWGHLSRWSQMGVHAKRSLDDGITWAAWRHGDSAGIPGSFSPRAGNTYGYKCPWATEWRDGIAAFWQDEKGLQWSRFDGGKWSPVEVIDPKATFHQQECGYRASGSAVTLGAEEIFVSATGVKGVLHWNGRSWRREIPGAHDQGYLSRAGKTVVLITAGTQRPRWYGGLSWGRKAKLECWRRRATGRWDGPFDLAGGEFEITVYRGYAGFVAPRVCPPNFVPVVWNARGETDLKLVRVPVK